MIIAKCGNFLLTHKFYLNNNVAPTTHNIEIRKQTNTGNQFTIADFDSEGQIRSCLDRLLTEIENDEDLDNVRYLAHIAWLIICRTEKISSAVSDTVESVAVKTVYHASFNDEKLNVHDNYFEKKVDAEVWLENNIVEMCYKLVATKKSTFEQILSDCCGVDSVAELVAIIHEGQDIEGVGYIEEVTID